MRSFGFLKEYNSWLWQLPVLTSTECEEIIRIASSKKLLGSLVDNGSKQFESSHRTCKEVTLTENDTPLIAKFREKLVQISGFSPEHFESIQCIRYEMGEEIIEHTDYYSHMNQVIKKETGNRKYSCLLYLNDNYIGGRTLFTQEQLEITPRAGHLVFFHNLLGQSSEGNPVTEHRSNPVTEGTKWILLTFITENKQFNTFLN